jgi:phosphatidate phosphatase PAH1
MYYLADFNRPLGAKDKQKRKKRNLLIAGGILGAVGLGTLGLKVLSKNRNPIPYKKIQTEVKNVTPKRTPDNVPKIVTSQAPLEKSTGVTQPQSSSLTTINNTVSPKKPKKEVTRAVVKKLIRSPEYQNLKARTNEDVARTAYNMKKAYIENYTKATPQQAKELREMRKIAKQKALDKFGGDSQAPKYREWLHNRTNGLLGETNQKRHSLGLNIIQARKGERIGYSDLYDSGVKRAKQKRRRDRKFGLKALIVDSQNPFKN